MSRVKGNLQFSAIRLIMQRYTMRRLFFKSIIQALVLLFCVSIPLSHAQSTIRLRGQILDSDNGSAVSGASVTLINTGYIEIASADGKFQFNNIVSGEYILRVTSVGYEEYQSEPIELFDGISIVKEIRLKSKALNLGKIKVSAQRENNSSFKVETIFREEIDQSGADNLSTLLEEIPGLLVQKGGSVGGPSQIKLRGASSDQVLVLLDGQKINQSGNGIAYLNTIPLSIIEKIEVYKGGSSAKFGSDALGGVINIETRSLVLNINPELHFNGKAGERNSRQVDLSADNIIHSDKFGAKIAYQKSESDGDFYYTYKIGDNVHRGIRLNNKTQSTNYYGSGVYYFGKSLTGSISGQIYNSDRGLPGKATDQNAYAYAVDDRTLTSASLRYESAKTTMNLALSYSNYGQSYIDTTVLIDTSVINQEVVYDTIPRRNFHSEYDNSSLTARYVGDFSLLAKLPVELGLEWTRDVMYHDDYIAVQMSMGKSVRNNIGMRASAEYTYNINYLSFVDRAVFDFAIRHDYAKTDKDSTSWLDKTKADDQSLWSPHIGAAIRFGESWSYSARASYGKSFHLPTLNALFWQGSATAHGNPGLKPERSEHSEIGLEANGSTDIFEFSAGITYFHANIDDYIIWTSSLGAWQPNNLQRVKMYGHEEFVDLSVLNGLIEIGYRNGINSAKVESDNHTIDGNDLIFTPHFITSYSLKLSWRFFESAYSIRHSDKAYTLLTNTKQYDSYRVDDFSFGARFKYKDNWKFRIKYKISNLNNESYVLLTHYPMPGQEWNIGLSVTYNR